MIILRDSEKLTRQQLEALVTQIKAIVYARVSSEGQVDNYSLESQIERSINEAETKFQINKDELIILVEEAESGDNPNRPMLNYLLFLFEKGIGKKVIILHPNRLSRYLHLQQNVAHKIWELGCDLHFVEFDLNKDNPESMFMFNIQGSVAQYNKAKILADTKRGRKTKVAKGLIPGLNRVYGYTYDKDLDTLVENPEEKKVYLLMVEMIVNEDKTCSEVARILSKRYAAPKGNRWYQATVSRILRNPLFQGNYYYGKTEIVQANGKKVSVKKPKEEWSAIPIPAYIDETTYNLLQLKLDGLSKNNRNVGRPSEDYLLRGLSKCGKCGASVSSGITSKTKTDLIKYYSCTRKAKKSFEVGTGQSNEVCRGRNWRVDKIDEKVWNITKSFIENPEGMLASLAERSGDQDYSNELKRKKSVLEKDLKEKQMAVERYVDLYASGFIKTKQALEEKIGNLQEQIDEMEKDIVIINDNLMYSLAEVDKTAKLIQAIEKYKKIISSDMLTIEEKRKLVNVFFEKVVLHEDSIEVVFKFGKLMGTDQEIRHENLINRQSDSLGFYAYQEDLIFLESRNPLGKYDSRLVEQRTEIEHLYFEELMTFEELGQKLGVNWWTIKNLFKDLGITNMTTKERAKLKRKRLLPVLLDMHYVQKLTLSEIYLKHNYSPQFVRQALTENEYQIKNYQHEKD